MSVDVGSEDSFDYSAFGSGPEDTGAAQGSVTDENAASVSTGEPAKDDSEIPGHYNEILDPLPAEFRNGVMEGLRKFDQNAQKMSEKIHAKYAGYKDFVEQGIDPTDVVQGLQFIDTLNQNPVALLENLKQMLMDAGMYQEAQQVEDKQDEIIEGQQQTPTLQEDPRLTELQKNQQIIMQRFEADQQAALETQVRSQIDSEMSQLVTQLGGNVAEAYKMEVAKHSARLGASEGRPVSLIEAHNDLTRLRRSFQVETARNAGPRIPSGAGSAGTPAPQPPALATKEDRAAAAAQILARGQ